MKTHFILSGGGGGLYSYYNIAFYRAIADTFPNKSRINVLSIPYAGIFPKMENILKLRVTSEAAKVLQSNLNYVNPHKNFIVQGALAFPLKHREDFYDQIRESDVLFAHGGDGDLLQETIAKFDISELISKDKVCAGFSAGCNMWVDSYYSNDNKRVCSGLGFVPIKTFCHYDWYKYEELNELIQYKPKLPVYPLTNDAFINIS